MAIAEISIIPLGTKTSSVGKYVAQAIKILQSERNIKYELSSMGTTIEGDLDDILRIARAMHEGIFAMGVTRVVTTVKIDERRDKEISIKSKLAAITGE
ncbi:MAG: MTH1187 family thiamine-binding protein [Dehalococcoidia bacterium]|nr:MTH1187 family thiamine-binding protein [Dehalococcoidia bacterium]